VVACLAIVAQVVTASAAAAAGGGEGAAASGVPAPPLDRRLSVVGVLRVLCWLVGEVRVCAKLCGSACLLGAVGALK
jgi:hypothetical protein